MFTLTFNLSSLASAVTEYVAIPKTCWLVKAVSVVNTTIITTADTLLTFSDGTTDIGTITITQSGCAVGDCDTLTLDTTSVGKVELDEDTPLVIEIDGSSGAGECNLTLVFSDFHGGTN